jgi:glyoxylase-like metal-dependent hydrolase (beta-lactamase superfamily II)
MTVMDYTNRKAHEMKITKHGEFLTQLTRWPRFFPVNVYLVREENELTLIDGGMKRGAKTILAETERISLPITRIVLTHSDPDHIGGLDEIRELLPDAELLMSDLSARLISGETVLDKAGNETSPRTRRELTTSRATGTLSEGDRVGSLEVFFAPGHKADQIALLDTRDRTLIAGDAFQTRGGLAVAGTIRWRFPFPGLATSDKAAAVDTARKLRAIEPSRLATGHGDVLESPLAEMDRVIDEAARKTGKPSIHAA